MSTQSVPHAADARKLFEECLHEAPPPIIADPEELTRKLRLIHLALSGLAVRGYGKALDEDLLPIHQTVGDALLLAEAIEEAGVRPPSAPDTPPAA